MIVVRSFMCFVLQVNLGHTWQRRERPQFSGLALICTTWLQGQILSVKWRLFQTLLNYFPFVLVFSLPPHLEWMKSESSTSLGFCLWSLSSLSLAWHTQQHVYCGAPFTLPPDRMEKNTERQAALFSFFWSVKKNITISHQIESREAVMGLVNTRVKTFANCFIFFLFFNWNTSSRHLKSFFKRLLMTGLKIETVRVLGPDHMLKCKLNVNEYDSSN